MLPFGKKVKCGNYVIGKYVRTLSKKEVEKLRDASGIPADVRKYLERAKLPYIMVRTIVDSWRIEWVAGLTMYNAIDEIPVMHDAYGNYEVDTEAAPAVQNLINFWASATATVGDEGFQADVIKAMQAYIKRETEKNAAPLSEKERDKVLEEARRSEEIQSALKSIKEYIDSKEARDGKSDN